MHEGNFADLHVVCVLVYLSRDSRLDSCVKLLNDVNDLLFI